MSTLTFISFSDLMAFCVSLVPSATTQFGILWLVSFVRLFIDVAEEYKKMDIRWVSGFL